MSRRKISFKDYFLAKKEMNKPYIVRFVWQRNFEFEEKIFFEEFVFCHEYKYRNKSQETKQYRFETSSRFL